MNVTLLNYTPDALELLLLTKQTRLSMTPGLLDEVRAWPLERKMAELAYMRGTIQSSWEFVDYVFLIDDVSRAFTHQLVRTRAASYAQQSQRTVDMSGFQYIFPRSLHPGAGDEWQSLCETGDIAGYASMHNSLRASKDPVNIYGSVMDAINAGYQRMIELGAPPQDARGILPTNISTNIVMKANLRTLADMAKTRLCSRTQGEYQDVFRAMRAAVLAVHPWAEPFIRVACAATGVCQFPNFMECPIKGPIFNPDTGHRWDNAFVETWRDPDPESMLSLTGPKTPATREEIQTAWEGMRYEAVPQHASAKRALPVVDG